MIREFLSQHKDDVLKKWRSAIFAAYSDNTAKMMKKENDRFANPIGYAISDGTIKIYDELIGEFDEEKLRMALDSIIRIRSVQDFSASTAVSFIPQLKKIIIELVLSEGRNLSNDEFLKFDSMLEKLTTMAFDIYVECREKLYEIKANSVRMRSYKLLEKAGQLERFQGQTGEENDESKL